MQIPETIHRFSGVHHMQTTVNGFNSADYFATNSEASLRILVLKECQDTKTFKDMCKTTLKTLCSLEYKAFDSQKNDFQYTTIDVLKILISIIENIKTSDELETFIELTVAPLRENKPIYRYPYPVALGAFLALLNSRKRIHELGYIQKQGHISTLDEAIYDVVKGQVIFGKNDYPCSSYRTETGKILMEGHMGGVDAFGSTILAIEYINRAVDVWIASDKSIWYPGSPRCDLQRLEEFSDRLMQSEGHDMGTRGIVIDEDNRHAFPHYSELVIYLLTRLGNHVTRRMDTRPSQLRKLIYML